jgi:hypothetical protein
VWLKELARGRNHASKISPRGKVAERSSQGTMRLGGEEQPADHARRRGAARPREIDHARRRGAARPREIYRGSKMSPRRRGGEQVGISSNGHKDQKRVPTNERTGGVSHGTVGPTFFSLESIF